MGGFAPSAENDADDRCLLISMISAAAGAITLPVASATIFLIHNATHRMRRNLAGRAKNEQSTAITRWIGFESFDLFDGPDFSGTNKQIEEIK